MDEQRRVGLRALAAQYQGTLNACHNLEHTVRVVANALGLAASYPEARADLLEAAAWLHDLGRGVERAQGISHAQISAELAAGYLPDLDFATEDVRIICTAIADHRYSSGKMPDSLEGKLLQDADRLDALGAIGIARTFAQGHDRAMYHPHAPFPDGRPLADDQYTLDHFFTKLLRLAATLHTEAARELAAQRTAYMRLFLRQLAGEIGQSWSG
ncbi:MAG TPA: HD domain-containing protein [Armatimonadota bacterium]